MNKSHLTALARKKPSAPIDYLFKNNYLKFNKGLDFGCGKGFDADYFGLEKYDPYYFPHIPKNKFDIILCTYVLNVVEKPQENKILKNIKLLLTKNGTAYISVRRDIKTDYINCFGTPQRIVKLSLPSIIDNNNFCIYVAHKEEL